MTSITVERSKLQDATENAWQKIDSLFSTTIPCQRLLVLLDAVEEELGLRKYSLLDLNSRQVAESFIAENDLLEITREDFIMLLQDLGGIEVLESGFKDHPMGLSEDLLAVSLDYNSSIGDYAGDHGHYGSTSEIVFSKQSKDSPIERKGSTEGSEKRYSPIPFKSFTVLESEAGRPSSFRADSPDYYASEHSYATAAASINARQLENEIKYRDQVIQSLEEEHRHLLHTISEQNLRLSYLSKENEQAQNQVRFVEKKLEHTLSAQTSMASMHVVDSRTKSFSSHISSPQWRGGMFDSDMLGQDVNESKLHNYINEIEETFSELGQNLTSLKAQSAQELSHINLLDSSHDKYNKKLAVLNNQLKFLLKEFGSVKQTIEDSALLDGDGLSDASFSGISEAMSDTQYNQLTSHLQKIKENTSELNGSLKKSLSFKGENLLTIEDCAESSDSSTSSSPVSKSKPRKKRPRRLTKHTSESHLLLSDEKQSKNVKTIRSMGMLKKPKSQLGNRLTPLRKLAFSQHKNNSDSNLMLNGKQRFRIDFGRTELPSDQKQTKEDNIWLSRNSAGDDEWHMEDESSFSIGNSEVDVLYSSKEQDQTLKIAVEFEEYAIGNSVDFENFKPLMQDLDEDDDRERQNGSRTVKKQVSLQNELQEYYSKISDVKDEDIQETPKTLHNNDLDDFENLQTLTKAAVTEQAIQGENIDLNPIKIANNEVGQMASDAEDTVGNVSKRIDFSKSAIPSTGCILTEETGQKKVALISSTMKKKSKKIFSTILEFLMFLFVLIALLFAPTERISEKRKIKSE